MTNWDSKIDEALAAKANRQAEAAEAKQAQEQRSARHRREAEDFIRDTLEPALNQVRELLSAPGRDREVEIRNSGPSSVTIYVTDPATPMPRSSELYVLFKFDAPASDPEYLHLTSDLGVYDKWHALLPIAGRIENITTTQIVDTLIETWTKRVSTGK